MDMYDAYIQKKNDLIHIAENIQRVHQRLWEFSDSELALVNTTGFYKSGYIPMFVLIAHHPELVADPAFQKLKGLYDLLRRDYFGAPDNLSPLYPLDKLATQMANRRMDEETYNNVLEGKMNCMIEAEKIIQKKQRRTLSGKSHIAVPFSVFEESVKIANEKAYRPSKRLENQ